MQRRLAPWTVALVVAATAVAGCGGSEDPSGSAGAPPASTATTGGETSSSGAGGGDAQTAQLFTQSCGSCHTFAAAGTSGQQGPNLDQIADGVDEVRGTIEGGGGGMPAFGSQLDARQIQALADYVVENRP